MKVAMDFWSNLSLFSLYALTVIICVFLLLLTLLYASEQFRKLWFSWFYTIFCTPLIKRGGNAIRAKLFEKLSTLETSDCSKQLSILEIGPARGNNFEFYPSNCRVIALDYNSYFEKYFRENKSKFPHIDCDKFVNGMAEDMRQIDNNSVDVVVATYVLCSVKDRSKTLKEIQRVLKKGGTYFFMEHVGYPQTSAKHIILFLIQLILQPFWYAFLGGCHCHRQSWSHIQRAGFQSINMNYEYPKEMFFMARAHIWGTATTHQSTDNSIQTNNNFNKIS